MDEVMDKNPVRKVMAEHFIKLLFVRAILLVIDAYILWMAWILVLVPKFNIPVLSKWEVLGLLFIYQVIIRRKQ
jgi:hypothetical protein